ncbi:cyclase family protein [Rhodococcus jostii]|uniref:Kynurenine formamidase n=1 Tax=Rhodococcus jostii TaxID=132919 RepID=A0A1H4ZEV0_RHOJO|nr:cyclase family protein [Rhodococcus jostii]SED27941.1 Kynurenine formamidase [Rhodococcus jostii]
MSRIIDISMVTDGDPTLEGKGVVFEPHVLGAQYNEEHYDIDPNHWPTPGAAFAVEHIDMNSHTGTHMDAPWHFGPVMADGSKPKTIEEWPLERCMGDGVVIDISDAEDGSEVSLAEIQQKLKDMDYTIKPGDIVLTMTGNDKYWGKPEYTTRGGGPSREALKWILEQGVTVVGTDAWSYDRPYAAWAADYHRHGKDPKYLWPCHLLGLEIEYAHIEKLANLDQLPPHGFKVIALPIKIAGGTAGFVRAVAIVDED